MEADIHTTYASGFYRILDFKCRCVDCRTSKPEYSEAFSISFVRKGNFLFNVFRHSLDSYTGCVLLTKPGYERTVTHVHTVPDECTIFDFTGDFYRLVTDMYADSLFFRNPDLHSTLVRTDTDMEFLHFRIMRMVLEGLGSRLQLDDLVMDLVRKVLKQVTDYRPDVRLDAGLKQRHLGTIERAKEYITEHFTKDVSLTEIATHCHVSPFHFSRLFTLFTGYAPHRFLLSLRLRHALMLLHDTAQPVSDIAYASGFNSLEHFTATFSRTYRHSPTAYRMALS